MGKGQTRDSGAVPLEGLEASAYRIPTDSPEADGTLSWESTTLVVVHLRAGGQTGLGYTYTDAAAATLLGRTLGSTLRGQDVLDVPARMAEVRRQVRNLGQSGLVRMALSALDAGLWDLKARLQGQLAGWAEQGFSRVKMKVGSQPEQDPTRVREVRRVLGEGPELFVDGNGAYTPRQALVLARAFAEQGVTWFEEPVSSDNLAGLRRVRDRAPGAVQVAAGEYGDSALYFRRMLEAEAVDVLQADLTRCGGVTGFLQADVLCEAFDLPLSAHCAPALHLHPCCAAAGAPGVLP